MSPTFTTYPQLSWVRLMTDNAQATKMNITSTRYPNISYEPGQEIIALPLESGLPFIFEVGPEVTCEAESMNSVGVVLDEIDSLIEKIKGFLSITMLDPSSDYYPRIADYIDRYRMVLDEKEQESVFPGKDLSELQDFQKIDFLKLDYVAINYEIPRNSHVVTFGFCFKTPLLSDTLAVCFSLEKILLDIVHET